MTQQHKPQGDHIPQVFKKITYTEISSSSNECNPPPIQEIFSTTNAHHPPNTHTHTHTLRCKDSCHPCRERNLLQLPEDQWGGSNMKNTWSHSITLEHLNAKTSKLRRPRTQPLTQQELILSIFPGANIYQYTNIPAPRLMPPDAHPNMIQSQLTRKRNQVLAFSPVHHPSFLHLRNQDRTAPTSRHQIPTHQIYSRGIWSKFSAAPHLLAITMLCSNSGSITDHIPRIPLGYVTTQQHKSPGSKTPR